MKSQHLLFIAILIYASAEAHSTADTRVCPASKGAALQVLGSGGPVADDGRASSGYLIWIDGKSRFLIDAGGGVFLRFGEAAARFEDLEFIAISHFLRNHPTGQVMGSRRI